MSERTDSVIKGLNLLAKHHDRPYSDWASKAATAAITKTGLLRTLEEAAEWYHAQKPTRYRHGDHKIIPVERDFNIYHVEGDNVILIPFPWEDQ